MKAIYLEQPVVSRMRAQGLSDTEIIDTMEAARLDGLLEIVADEERETVGVRLTDAGIDVMMTDPPPGKAKAKNRHHRKLFRRQRR